MMRIDYWRWRCFRAIVFLTLIPLVGGAQDTPMFRNDPAHSGVYSDGVPQFHRVRWTFHTKGDVVSSPAVVSGVLYIGSNDGKLYALDAQTGAQKWAFDTHGRVASSPAVAAGLVYFGSYDGNFYAVNSETGKAQWKFPIPGERRYAATHLHGAQPAGETMPDPFDVYLSSPTVWNGAVYFGSGDGNVYALDAGTGELKWKFHTGDVVHASPAIADGRVFIGSWDSLFYALDAATGKELWRFKTGEDPNIHNQVGIQSSATVNDGVVYFGCRDSNLYAVEAATGKLRWSFNNKGSWVIVSPVVHEGKLYFATSDSAMLHVLNAHDGTSVHSTKFKWLFFSSPAIAGNVLYLAGQDGKLMAIDLATNEVSWTFQSNASQQNLATLSKPDGGPNYEAVFKSDFYDDVIVALGRLHDVAPFLSSPVISGKTLYIGSTDGNVYAIE